MSAVIGAVVGVDVAANSGVAVGDTSAGVLVAIAVAGIPGMVDGEGSAFGNSLSKTRGGIVWIHPDSLSE
jgi:hypothetical protein